MCRNRLITSMALLFLFSLTACQPASLEENALSEDSTATVAVAEQPQQENSADISDESVPETAPDELFLVHTGIETDITEYDAEYPQYAELKKYLDEKQFTLLRIAHKRNTELFKGREALDYVADWDWDLVRPLQNVSANDCGYGKIDFNNDKTAEIIYRTIGDNRQITAIVYEPDSAAVQIVSEYNLADIFPSADLTDAMLQQLWFEKIGEDVVTFRLLRKNDSEEFVIYSDIVTVKDSEIMCSRLETRNLTVTTEQTDNAEQDIFRNRTLDLTKGEGEAFEALRRKQLIAYQKERQIDTALETTKLPEGFVDVLKEELAGRQYYDRPGDMEKISVYEDEEHQLTLEQVQAYFGEAFPDYYGVDGVGGVDCAYLADLDEDGNEELVVFLDSGGTGGFAFTEIWRKQEDGTAEQLYSISELRGYAALLDFDDAYYFVVRQYNYYTRETEGFTVLAAGENGMLQQYLLCLENKENRKSWFETYHNQEMDTGLEQWLTDYLEKMKREVEEKTVPNDDYQLLNGSIEIPYPESAITFPLDAFSVSKYGEQSCCIVDFDNDGRMECVEKTIWQPSSLNTTLGLIIDFYKEYDSYAHEIEVRFPCFSNSDPMYLYSESFGTPVENEEMFEKFPVQLWFEEFDQKVYTFYMYRIGAGSDYLLEVSLIEGEKLHPLLQYLLIAEKEYTFEQVDFKKREN